MTDSDAQPEQKYLTGRMEGSEDGERQQVGDVYILVQHSGMFFIAYPIYAKVKEIPRWVSGSCSFSTRFDPRLYFLADDGRQPPI